MDLFNRPNNLKYTKITSEDTRPLKEINLNKNIQKKQQTDQKSTEKNKKLALEVSDLIFRSKELIKLYEGSTQTYCNSDDLPTRSH
jgi:hypothetical protein